MFYLYVFFSPRLRHDHELFYALLDIVFYMLPLTVFIEITCPNIVTAADYIYIIRMIQMLGYSVSWINRFPCAGAGDFCDRERFTLIAYYSNHCPKIDYDLQHGSSSLETGKRCAHGSFVSARGILLEGQI